MCRLSDPRGRRVARQSSASKRHLIFMPTFVDVPEIKLIRTDTTLDLSQKAEKVCFCLVFCRALYRTGAYRWLTGPRNLAVWTAICTHFHTNVNRFCVVCCKNMSKGHRGGWFGQKGSLSDMVETVYLTATERAVKSL